MQSFRYFKLTILHDSELLPITLDNPQPATRKTHTPIATTMVLKGVLVVLWHWSITTTRPGGHTRGSLLSPRFLRFSFCFAPLPPIAPFEVVRTHIPCINTLCFKSSLLSDPGFRSIFHVVPIRSSPIPCSMALFIHVFNVSCTDHPPFVPPSLSIPSKRPPFDWYPLGRASCDLAAILPGGRQLRTQS